MLTKGQIIKWKEGKKRLFFRVEESSASGAKLSVVYKPSPRSRLKNRNLFSKNKHQLIT